MRSHTRHGFTLLELSVVLVIIAIVTGISIGMGVSVLASVRQASTQQKMKAIDDALMQYRTANDRLPCPASLSLPTTDANYGIEGATPGTCTGGTPAANFSAAGATNTGATGVEGTVPTRTLGLPNDFLYDGWGNRFRYAIDASMTLRGAFSGLPLACAPKGAITVKDANGTARSTASIYALISHGSNGHGAYTRNGVTINAGSVNANEQTNCHCDSSGAATAYAPTYVRMDPTLDSANALDNFDDLVTARERSQMQLAWDAASCAPYTYVTDYNNNRVEKFDRNGNWVLTIPSSGCGGSYPSPACPASSASGHFNGPWGMGTDAGGNVYVAEYLGNRVQKFDANGNWLSQVGGTGGTGNGQFSYPTQIAPDASGNIWVMDTANERLQKFNSAGNYLSKFGSFGTANGQFWWPLGVSVDAGGNIWVVDLGNHRVQKFDSSGNWLLTIPPAGCGGSYPSPACPASSANGRFGANSPRGLAVDASGNIWVADYDYNRVQKFDTGGTYLGQIGCPPGPCSSASGNGQFSYPGYVFIDTGGNIWVTDSGNNRVQKFDSNGSYLNQFGAWGLGDGQFSWPVGAIVVNR